MDDKSTSCTECHDGFFLSDTKECYQDFKDELKVKDTYYSEQKSLVKLTFSEPINPNIDLNAIKIRYFKTAKKTEEIVAVVESKTLTEENQALVIITKPKDDQQVDNGILEVHFTN